MPRPKTAKTTAFTVSVKTRMDVPQREIARYIREQIAKMAISVRVTPIKEAE